MKEVNQCPEFPYFGAPYPDARCIDGYLWDLDRCDGDNLYGGGEDACPFCNKEEFIKQHKDPLNGYTMSKVESWVEDLNKRYNPEM